MEKEKLLQLLKLNIIGTEEAEFQELIKLTEEEADILIKYKGDKKSFYKFMKYFKHKAHYNEIVGIAKQIENKQALDIFFNIANEPKLNRCSNYIDILKMIGEKETIEIMKQFTTIVLAAIEFNKENYMSVLKFANKMDDILLLYKFRLYLFNQKNNNEADRKILGHEVFEKVLNILNVAETNKEFVDVDYLIEDMIKKLKFKENDMVITLLNLSQEQILKNIQEHNELKGIKQNIESSDDVFEELRLSNVLTKKLINNIQ